MKLTVRFKDTEIIYDESDNDTSGGSTSGKSTIKWADQMKRIHDTVVLMVEQCIKLK